MKLPKFITKAAKAITGFFQSVFGKEFAFLKKNADVAVAVTERLKQAVESPIALVLAQLIPGSVDDQILYQLQRILPKVANEMLILRGIVQASPTNSSLLGAIAAHLKGLTENDRALFLIEFSGRINLYLSDGKLSFGEAVTLAQMVYLETKKPK